MQKSKTRLKPYNPLLYSPIKRFARKGELGILLDPPEKRGYCVLVIEEINNNYKLKFLDSDEDNSFLAPKNHVIPTGKTPEDLINLYPLTSSSLDAALEKERTTDFEHLNVKKKKRSSSKKKALEKELMRKVILELLREKRGVMR